MAGITATSSIVIHTTAARAWEALITPSLIKEYLFGTDASSDWKVGSTITYKGVWEGKPYEDKGIILKLEPNQVLETNYWSPSSGLPDSPENYHKVIYSLSESDGQTTVTITQDNNATEEAKAKSETNWDMVLQGLKKLLEK